MADQQINQTPQSSPVSDPGETVDITPPFNPVGVGLNTSIRNIRQTAQEREIIKTAPDIIIYLDGLPYLINHYLDDPNHNNQPYVVVNFNDHVQGFAATYDVDNLVPSGSVHLSVPNHQRKLYQMPGGNNVIVPMMEVQVFAKGYFLSPSGNTIYHRVFKGLATQVTHTDNGKTLEINITLRGVLRFMEMMQIDVQPSLQSNSNLNAPVYTSIQWNLDPFQQIADTFLRSLSLDQFQLNTIANQGQTVRGSQWAQAVQADYISKWQTTLNGILADTHIMGYLFGSVPKKFDEAAKDSPLKGKMDPVYQAAAIAKKSNIAESDPIRQSYVNVVRGYTPDFGVSTVTLTNGRIVPRLERIRQVLHNIGFEGFQDINGEIIVKPPLYNLDVTNLAAAPASKDSLQPSPMNKLTEQNNPFVVFLSEIENEMEMEDEGMVRCTRLSVQGTWSRTFQVSVDPTLRAAVSHIDIPKLARFGLREEPVRTIPWVTEADKWLLYAYASNELVRDNRGWRTYSFEMPLRPELRLGFPMYIPHKDMYGYIKTVSINYNIAGKATMSVMLDSIRKRPMFPTSRKMPGTQDPLTGQPVEETILVTQPNLVMKWTQPPLSSLQSRSAQQAGFGNGDLGGLLAGPTVQSGRPSSTGDTPSNNPQVNQVGNPATLVQPTGQPKPTDEEIQFSNYRKSQIGTDWSTRSDTYTHSFRVQNDVYSDGPDKPATGSPFFSRDNWLKPTTTPTGAASSGIDYRYFQAIVSMQPYTDEKGYEVIGVWPLGRWKSLPEAYKETREGKLVDYVNPQDQQFLKQQDALLFAGLGTPSDDAAGSLLNKFQQLTDTVSTNSSFELIYSTQKNAPVFGPQPAESNLLQLQQPDNQPQPISDIALESQLVGDVQDRVNLFISGMPQPLDKTKQELKIANDNTDSPTDFATVVSDFKQLGSSSD